MSVGIAVGTGVIVAGGAVGTGPQAPSSKPINNPIAPDSQQAKCRQLLGILIHDQRGRHGG
jgi:hypothetical protein